MAIQRIDPFHSLRSTALRVARRPILALLLGALAPAGIAADQRCDWHGPKSGGESQWSQCFDYAALSGKTMNLPSNVTRIAHDGVTFCSDAFKTTPGAADIIYMMDNSGSMEQGENSGGFNSSPGDPYGIRDRVIRKAMRQQQISADTATAGFISFIGLGTNVDYTKVPELETRKLQPPLDISRGNPQGTANLNTLLSKVYKRIPSEALLPKVSAPAPLAKKAITFWSEALEQALAYLNPDMGYTLTKNHAIILVSDGAIGDWNEVQAMAPRLPPVYGIHLGGNSNATHLEDLTKLTKGKFYLVSPTDTAAFHDVMASIVGIITKNPLPKEVKLANSSLAPIQTSRSLDFIPNPDGSLGLALDSIVGLRTGMNQISIEVTKDDASKVTWSFGLEVAEGGAPGSTGGQLTCHDPARLRVVDEKGDTQDVYAREASKLKFELQRSPSDLVQVTLGIAADGGDKENVAVKPGRAAMGPVVQEGEVLFNGMDGKPLPQNGTVQVDAAGNVSFTWSHPRDPREQATYVLLGRKVPVMNAEVDIRIRKEVVLGPPADQGPVRLDNPIVIVDRNNKCVKNCAGTETVIEQKDFIPGWTATVRSPIRLSIRLFDNLGHFVNASEHEFTQADWEALPKDGDSARVELLYHPVSQDGRTIGTGAYVMRMEIVGLGGGLVKNSAGETVEIQSSRQKLIKRFGYVRQ